MQSQREEYGVIYAMNIHILSGKGASPPAPSAEGVRHGTRGVRSAGQEEEGVTLRAEKKTARRQILVWTGSRVGCVGVKM